MIFQPDLLNLWRSRNLTKDSPGEPGQGTYFRKLSKVKVSGARKQTD